MVIAGTPGMQLRVLMNRLEVGNGGGDSNGGAWVEVNPTVGNDGKAVVGLMGYTFVRLNAIKNGWESPEGTISSVTLSQDAPTGIESVSADDGTCQIYTIDGKPVKTLQKGVNIIRYQDGNVKKVYVK